MTGTCGEVIQHKSSRTSNSHSAACSSAGSTKSTKSKHLVGSPYCIEDSKRGKAIHCFAHVAKYNVGLSYRPASFYWHFCRCSRCKQSCYCSRACQRANWVLHKDRCGIYALMHHVGKHPSESGLLWVVVVPMEHVHV